MKYFLRRLIGLYLAALFGCSRNPAVLLDPAGPHAAETDKLFKYMGFVEAVVLILVLGFFFLFLWKRRTSNVVEPIKTSAITERRLTIHVGLAVALTFLILTSFVVMSFVTDHRLILLDRNPTIEIEVTAHQWWWELRYLDRTPSNIFITANEIHVPVGANVRLILKSADVIHSLWIPNLAGKKDIIPGREQDLFIRADRPGVWHGRCGEFCGMQHAMMGLLLFVESKEQFDHWESQQRQPAVEPTTLEEKHGRDIFAGASCALCHNIRKNQSTGFSNNAPDLTHLKARTTIGAVAAPNSKGYLAGWIIDPHSIKPGVHMPTVLQEPEDFQALLSYLETLK